MATDSFGVEIEAGDFVLSASTSGARVKVGWAEVGPSGMRMRVTSCGRYGKPQAKFMAVSAFGYNVVVLRKANGAIPPHIDVF